MKTALEILNKEAPIFQQDFDTELRDRCVKAMESFAAQSVIEDREQFKKYLALKVYEAMHDGVLKYGVIVKPSAKDLKDLIESTH